MNGAPGDQTTERKSTGVWPATREGASASIRAASHRTTKWGSEFPQCVISSLVETEKTGTIAIEHLQRIVVIAAVYHIPLVEIKVTNVNSRNSY
jgi:hypothetical protein